MILQFEIPDEIAVKVGDSLSDMSFKNLGYHRYDQMLVDFPNATKKDWAEYIIKGYVRDLYKGYQAHLAARNKEDEIDIEFII